MALKLNGFSGPFVKTVDVALLTDGCEIESIALSLENHVTPTDKYAPLTGVYSIEDDINGWMWDRRLLESNLLSRSQYMTYLGGHAVGLKEGTQLEFWQSGSLLGTEYFDLTHFRFGEFLTWTPRVKVGAYSLYYDGRPLYSDFSFSQNFSTEGLEHGVMAMRLRHDALNHTIGIGLYERDTSFRIFKRYDFDFVDEFTGEIDEATNTRLDTQADDGTILWGNIATRKNEYTIRDQKIYLNGDYRIVVGDFVESVGFPQAPDCTLKTLAEDKGYGQESGRSLFSRFFPVQPGSVQVQTVSGTGAITVWTEVENLDFSEPTDLHYSVDYDLGIVTMGGYTAPDLVLKYEMTETDTELTVHPGIGFMDQFPDQGVLIIDGEEIAYFGKGLHSFFDLIRGYNGTSAIAHGVGAIVKDRKHGSGTGDQIYMSYTAVPRVDYEVTSFGLRSANKTPWLDIRPARNVLTNNILQILSADVNLQKVVLETDSPLIGGNLFGPVFFGTDISRLTARALDARDNPVEDIPLTIEVIKGNGLLNGVAQPFTDISNSLGEIYSFYNSPYDKDSIEYSVIDVQHDGPNTKMTVRDLPPELITEDVWVFQVLKHDSVTGTVGLQSKVFLSGASAPPYGFGFFNIDGFIDEGYEGGFLYIVGTDGVRYRRNITNVQQINDGITPPYTRIYIDVYLSSALADGQPVWLYRPEAVEWNPAVLNGVRVILYEYRNDVLHPLTGALGAYFPVHPDSVSGNVLTFNNRNLPIPAPEDDTSNLGGYVVISPGLVSLQAHGRDPITGRVVQSNIVRLFLTLPSFLTGVDTSGALPIPVGWTLISDEFNVGSGLGGANFITINPAADGINQFSLTGAI